MAVSALMCGAAQAEISDTIHPFLEMQLLSDDNLLRLEDSQELDGRRSDTYRVLDGGITFERPIGRQLISGEVKLSKVSFNKFSELDYNGKDANGVWNWVVGNHLSGHIGGLYSQTLAPFSDFHSNDRNVRTRSKVNADGAYLFHPRWQVRAGFTREKYSYDLEAQRYNNRTEDTSELGVDYLAPSGSKIGVQLRHLKGSYDNGIVNSVLLFDGYTQDELKANILWVYSGITQVQFLGGYARREHAVFTSRDDSGVNGRMVATWMPLGKVKFVGSAWREFAAVEGSLVNSSLNKGVSLDTVWTATGKITVDLMLRDQKRHFQPISGSTLELAQGSLDDTSTSATLGLVYLWRPNLQLNLNAAHEKRDGNAATGTNSYKSNSVSFGARAQF